MSMVDDDSQQAIPDDTTGGVAPPISTDNTADDSQPGPQPQAAPAPAADPNASPTSGLLQDAQNTPLNKGIKSIVAYLAGAGAAPQEQVSDNGDKNLQMVEEAAKKGGPAAAFAIVQANRQAYNAKQAFAYTALNGIDGKAGDIASAADAATKAGAHILDGSTIAFQPEGASITATVKGAGPNQKIKLTPEQFNQYLDVGGDGQYDKILENGGAPTVLQQIARGQGKPLAPTATPQPGSAPQAPQQPGVAHSARSGDNGPTEGGLSTDPSQDSDYDAIKRRAYEIFPWASQTAQRGQWMQQQEGALEERQSKLDVANAGNTAKERVAGIRADANRYGADRRVDTQQVRSDSQQQIEQSRSKDRAAKLQSTAAQTAARLAVQSKNNDERSRLSAFRAELTNPNRVLMTDDQVNQTAQKYGVDKLLGMNLGQTPQAPSSVQAPNPQTPPATNQQPSAANTPVPPAAQRQVNQVYTTPKGRFRWMGNGWQPAQ